MIPALILAVAAAELTLISYLIAHDGGDSGELARLTAPLAPARAELAAGPAPIGRRVPGATITADLGEPDDVQIGRPPPELLERLHAGLAALPLTDDPWRPPPEPGLTVPVRRDPEGWGPYIPRHAAPGPDTLVFRTIIAAEDWDTTTRRVA